MEVVLALFSSAGALTNSRKVGVQWSRIATMTTFAQPTKQIVKLV
jgi:hypothetical protein